MQSLGSTLTLVAALFGSAQAQCESPQVDHVSCATWGTKYCTNTFYTLAIRQQYCGTFCNLCGGSSGALPCANKSPEATCTRWANHGFCNSEFYNATVKALYCAGTCTQRTGTDYCTAGAVTAATGATTTAAPTTTPDTTSPCILMVDQEAAPVEIPRGAPGATTPTKVDMNVNPPHIIKAITIPANPTGCTLTLSGGAAGNNPIVITEATAKTFTSTTPGFNAANAVCTCP